MAKSDLQFAGEFLVIKCELMTTNGTTYDIRQLVQSINIYEDIFSTVLVVILQSKTLTTWYSMAQLLVKKNYYSKSKHHRKVQTKTQ